MTYSIQTDNGHVFLTATNIMDAREWVADCEWSDDISELTDREIINGISRHYDGGWGAFLADGY